MIRLKHRFGSIPKGTVTDALCEQAERELVRIGAAETVQKDAPEPEQVHGQHVWRNDMTKRELMELAEARGLSVSPKATKADIIAALEGQQ